MASKTEQKILEVALKIFAEKWYAGATTRIIALKSVFTELTLFRKFKTKENLYNMVIQYTEKMLKDYHERNLEAPEISWKLISEMVWR